MQEISFHVMEGRNRKQSSIFKENHMDIFKKRLAWSGVLLLGLPLLSIPSAYAAKPVNLAHQKLTTLQSFLSAPASGTEIREISRSVSKSNTLHIRVQQMYSGYKVWGA